MSRFSARIVWLTILIFVGLIPAAAAPSGFRGAWSGTDIDGSNLQLTIAGGGAIVTVIYRDDVATGACPVEPDSGYPAFFQTSGTINGDTLTLDAFDVICLGRPRMAGPSFGAGLELTYDPLTDTVTDFVGATYRRRGSG